MLEQSQGLFAASPRFGMELALDERLMVQKHLIKMAVDCGESLEDTRTQAKAEIGEAATAFDGHLKTEC